MIDDVTKECLAAVVDTSIYRERDWDTQAGRITLAIPKLRKGTYFPSFLEPRRTAEKTLAAVIQEAYVHGVSTRSADDLVRAMGAGGMSKSQVARLCADIDERVNAFLQRPLKAETLRRGPPAHARVDGGLSARAIIHGKWFAHPEARHLPGGD